MINYKQHFDDFFSKTRCQIAQHMYLPFEIEKKTPRLLLPNEKSRLPGHGHGSIFPKGKRTKRCLLVFSSKTVYAYPIPLEVV